MNIKEIETLPRIVVTNEDCTFNKFVKAFHEKHNIFD